MQANSPVTSSLAILEAVSQFHSTNQLTDVTHPVAHAWFSARFPLGSRASRPPIEGKMPSIQAMGAGIQQGPFEVRVLDWIPAFAGMTTGWGRKRQTLYKANYK